MGDSSYKRTLEQKQKEDVEKIRQFILIDQLKSCTYVANVTSMSTDRVRAFFKIMDMVYHLNTWVPRMLTDDQKLKRMQISQECLYFLENTTDFVNRFVTNGIWISNGDITVAASIFWDARGILLIDYFSQNEIPNEEYYVNVLDRLDKNIREKRPDLAQKKVIYYQNDAHFRSSVVSIEKITHKLQYNLLMYPLFSPELCPSSINLFPRLNDYFNGRKCTSIKEFKEVADEYFPSLGKSKFCNYINEMKLRWHKCIRENGNYFTEL